MLNDVGQLGGFALHGVLVPVGRVATAIGILATMVYLSWKLTLVVLVLGPMLGIILRYTALRIRKRVDAAQQSKAQMTGLLHEQFRGLLEILSYGAQEQERERFAGINRQSATHALAAVRHHATSEAVIGVALIVTLAAVIGFGAYQVTQGNLPRTDLFTFGLLFVAVYEPIRQLSTTSYEIQRSVASARRIYAFLDTPSECRDGRPIAEPVRGAVRFEEVGFRYDDEQEPVLSDVDIRIEPRDSVALVGASGAGKTSFLYVLLGFYPPSRGRVLIDEQNVAELRRDSVRKHIGWVSQNPFLFQGTIRDNIRFGKFDTDDAEVQRAARLADVDSFVDDLPEGYGTRLTETGGNLSQGQRMRIALARAILRDPPILILDEPTSALDSETEARIYSEIAEWLQQRTTIVISHRLSTVLSCRSGIVLEGGRVAGQGPMRSLLAECEPFRRIFHKQIAQTPHVARLDGAGAR
jgi:ABC-type multidrug transport system fused ATPase/permease subunit